MTEDTGYTFAVVEKFLWETFLPFLFFGKSKPLPSIVETVSTIPVKKSSLGLQDLVTSANYKYLSLIRTNINLIVVITGERGFSTAGHPLVLREESRDGKNIWYDANKAKLKGLVKDLEALNRRLIFHTKKTGSWLTVWGATVTSTVLAST